MKVEVLLSCMHAEDFSIIKKSNLCNVNTLIVNQCVTEKEECVIEGIHRMIKTPTRGLSVSRNLAVDNSKADVCLISDDDEVFTTQLEEKIRQAYLELPDADVIIFKMSNRATKLGNATRRLGKYDLLRVSSWQISFKLSSIRGKVFFDTNLGAGTGNGAGEENKFLLDCYKNKLKIYYVPVEIATVAQTDSTWFFGYTEEFFFNRGKTTRYILGIFTASLYGVYFLIRKYHMYKNELSIWKAGKCMLRGLLAKHIGVCYE